MTFKREFLIVLIALLGAKQVTQAADYCNMKSCSGAKHIGCNNNGAFGSACASNAQIPTMTTDLKNAILERHNVLRNTIAKGAVTKYKPATRMATMVWDNELAQLAVLNVKQCQMKHDACRATTKFPYAGQNLAYTGWSGGSNSVQSIAISHVNMWYDEEKDADMAYINSYSNPSNGKVIGHFTQLVQEKATHVGCGILRETKDGWTYQFMACNYAITNVISRPVYTSGSKGASACKTGTNSSYPFLCSTKEVYDVSNL